MLFALFSFLIASAPARAEFVFLPVSRHQQSQTYAFLTEEVSSALLRNGGKGWMALGGTLTLLEASDWRWRPQLAIFASANAGFRFNAAHDAVLTETIDARAGININLELEPESRLQFGWTHMSGHAMDDIQDRDLFGSNLGVEVLHFRFIHDISDQGRWGGSLRPVLGAEPKMRHWWFDQFAEWFPWHVAANPRQPTPYIALGFEEYGTDHIQLTTHAQVGIFFGNHMRPEKLSSVRFALGYYNGVDPRLKYAQFKLRRDEFGFLGMFFEF